MGHFLCDVDKTSSFVNVRLHCINSNLNLVSKMSTLPPLGKILRTPVFLGQQFCDLNFDNHVHGGAQFIRRINIKRMQQ